MNSHVEKTCGPVEMPVRRKHSWYPIAVTIFTVSFMTWLLIQADVREKKLVRISGSGLCMLTDNESKLDARGSISLEEYLDLKRACGSSSAAIR